MVLVLSLCGLPYGFGFIDAHVTALSEFPYTGRLRNPKEIQE
jgi:hypothetical protein